MTSQKHAGKMELISTVELDEAEGTNIDDAEEGDGKTSGLLASYNQTDNPGM